MQGAVGCGTQWDALPFPPRLMCFIRFFTRFCQSFPSRQWAQGWGEQQLRCVGVPWWQ